MELNTVLCKVEGSLNSPPLCCVSQDEKIEILTPKHLLGGCYGLSGSKFSIYNLYSNVSSISNKFFQVLKDFYLNEIMEHHKNHRNKSNEVKGRVLYKEENKKKYDIANSNDNENVLSQRMVK